MCLAGVVVRVTRGSLQVVLLRFRPSAPFSGAAGKPYVLPYTCIRCIGDFVYHGIMGASLVCLL